MGLDNTRGKILVTGACGFIGSAFVQKALAKGYFILAFDKLTYAGSIANLKNALGGKTEDAASLFQEGLLDLVIGDIADPQALQSALSQFQPVAVVHFAAESHVDRSIQSPEVFIHSNINGTFHCLEQSMRYWEKKGKNPLFRFLHVSTDEVFGSLPATGFFHEKSPLAPRSPYAASKAASDVLVGAWWHTYGFPVMITRCSNNYGPRQFPEKLIPHMILCALKGEPLPIYGNGKHIRDWIYVEDHVEGILCALEKGQPGASYCFGGNQERTNIQVVEEICRILDMLLPQKNKRSYQEQICFVKDRSGHDMRYAMDDRLAQEELGFKRRTFFEDGLKKTVKWYLDHPQWTKAIFDEKKKR